MTLLIGVVLLVAFFQPPWTTVATARLRRARVIICRTESRIDLAAWIVGMLANLLIGGSPPYSIAFTFVAVSVTALYAYFLWHAWRRRKLHRDHDEDCKYGPKRRRGRVGARLTWRKAALNPAFAPT